MKKTFVLISNIIFIICLFAGCTATHKGPSVCENEGIFEQSFLCQAASRTGIPLEEYGNLLLDVEASLLITEKVQANEIKEFIKLIRDYIRFAEGETYNDIISKTLKTAKDRALASIISRRIGFFASDLPVSDIDTSFLLWQLNELEAML